MMQAQAVLQNWGPVAVIMGGYMLGLYFQARSIVHLDTRINDVKDLLRAEAAKNQSELRVEMGELRTEIARNHSELLMKFADLSHRIERLEEPRLRP